MDKLPWKTTTVPTSISELLPNDYIRISFTKNPVRLESKVRDSGGWVLTTVEGVSYWRSMDSIMDALRVVR